MSSQALVKLCSSLLCFVGLLWILTSLPFDNAAALVYYRERILLTMHPSAERAYEYGAHYFDSAQPAFHDIDRAEYFFRKTVEANPTYPYAHHQLARIHFLQGDFSGALTEIDREIAIQAGRNPGAYYVRGLIKGFAGSYVSAAEDFRHFLTLKPDSWAGANDHAWVLMKSGSYREAKVVLESALGKHPDSAWLLNSYAVALYETGEREAAIPVARRAKAAVEQLRPEDWSAANPGNDPRIAVRGLETFRKATIQNLDIIAAGETSDAVQLIR